MRATHLMSGAAAVALMALPALASAQEMRGPAGAGPGRAPAAQPSAPAEKVAPPLNATKDGLSAGSPGSPSSAPNRGQARDMLPPSSPATTGQGAAGASANLTNQQRTAISTVIRQQKVRPVTNVNFTLAIGTALPRDVELYPLPATVIEVYPAWRGYRFILVGDEIVVVDPGTFRIVAIIEA